MLKDSTRVLANDKWFDVDESGGEFKNFVFVRLIAKNRKFTSVSFKYVVFESCYLRDCVFDSCDFTGCRFISCNFHGSTFSGCRFDYATFEKTNIDSGILDTNCPAFENLKAQFARTLRTNFLQLGDSNGVNKAVAVELKAAETHMHKAWNSKESYYRKKYKGTARLKMLAKWLAFKALDFIWGNGESPLKLIRTLGIVLIIMAAVDVFVWGSSIGVGFGQSLVEAPQIFMGTLESPRYPNWYVALIAALRLIAFGFFTSILVKRFSRR